MRVGATQTKSVLQFIYPIPDHEPLMQILSVFFLLNQCDADPNKLDAWEETALDVAIRQNVGACALLIRMAGGNPGPHHVLEEYDQLEKPNL